MNVGPTGQPPQHSSPNWRIGWLVLTLFIVFLLLSFVTLPVLTTPPDSGLALDGLIQLASLLLLSVIVFGVATFTSFFKGDWRSDVPLAVMLGSLGYIIVRRAAAALLGTVMLSPAAISLFVLLDLFSAALFTVSVYGRFRASQRQQQQAAALDPLTSLLNRCGFEQALAALPGRRGLLAVLDINRLKAVNELHGHSEGDRYIQAISRQLREQLARPAVLCRWGGDEFLAFFPDLTLREAAAQLRALQAQLPGMFPGVPAVSFGVSVLDTATPFERALAIANHEMYSEKQQQAPLDRTGGVDSGLYDFSSQLEALKTPDEVIRTGLGLLRRLLHFDVATYFEMSDGFMLARHLDQAEDRAISLPGFLLGERVPLRLMPARVVESRSTVISVDYPGDPLAFGPWVEAGVKTTLLTPILIGGEVVAVLTLVHLDTWKSVSLEMQRMLELAALRLGHALELFRVAEATRLNLEGGLLGLGAALEARDLETQGHTERVVEMAVRLGRTIGLTGPALDDLRQGAFLHDIGKLSIPDAILLKPASLTPDEWTVMKSHTVLGADIASRIPSLSPGALDVIRHHHERWDGSGYPDRLIGDQIALNARIFAVCDVFDALTHQRPYKPAWRWEEARTEIARQRERQFCPLVVDTFLRLTASGPDGEEGPTPT